MTMVLTPYGRFMARRRMMDRMMDDEWEDESNRVIFPVDIRADDDAYVVTALLPGITAEDLTIQVVNDTLTIQGVLGHDRDEHAAYILQERPSGKFCRVINLPESVDSNKAEADLKNGVLSLRIPKAEEARPKTIKITTK